MLTPPMFVLTGAQAKCEAFLQSWQHVCAAGDIPASVRIRI